MDLQSILPSLLAGVFALVGVYVGSYLSNRQAAARDRRAVLDAKLTILIDLFARYQPAMPSNPVTQEFQHDRDLGIITRAYAICISVKDTELTRIAETVFWEYVQSPGLSDAWRAKNTEAMRRAILRMAELMAVDGGQENELQQEP